MQWTVINNIQVSNSRFTFLTTTYRVGIIKTQYLIIIKDVISKKYKLYRAIFIISISTAIKNFTYYITFLNNLKEGKIDAPNITYLIWSMV